MCGGRLKFRVLVEGCAHLAQAVLHVAALVMRECGAVSGRVRCALVRHGHAIVHLVAEMAAEMRLLLVVRCCGLVVRVLVVMDHGVDLLHAFVEYNAVFAGGNIVPKGRYLAVHQGSGWVSAAMHRVLQLMLQGHDLGVEYLVLRC